MKLFTAFMAMAGLMVAAEAQEQKEFPKPGKEQALLKQQFEGDWDATMRHEKDGKREESKGTETNKMAFDGYWLITDFKGDHHGKPFVGHGAMGYDPMKKKYVMSWIDNMSPSGSWSEGEADAAGKTFTFTHEGYCPDLGKTAKLRTVFEFPDSAHYTLTFYMPGKGGAEEKKGEILFTRKS